MNSLIRHDRVAPKLNFVFGLQWVVILAIIVCSCKDPMTPAPPGPWQEADSSYLVMQFDTRNWNPEVTYKSMTFNPLTKGLRLRYAKNQFSDSTIEFTLAIDSVLGVGEYSVSRIGRTTVEYKEWLGMQYWSPVSGVIRITEFDTVQSVIRGELDVILSGDFEENLHDTIGISNARFGGFNFMHRS